MNPFEGNIERRLKMRNGRLSLAAVLGFALIVAAPPAAADQAEYRPLALPPPPPDPQEPAFPPSQPCNIQPFAIDCNPGGDWLLAEVEKLTGYGDELSPWIDARLGDVVAFGAGDFNFVGTGTSTTVHVHDDVSLPLVHDHVRFVVQGGPANAYWNCEHICTVPDASITVTLDLLSVPPEHWVNPTVGFAPISGLIEVTFNP